MAGPDHSLVLVRQLRTGSGEGSRDWGLLGIVLLLAVLTATPIIRGKLQLLDVVCLGLLPFLIMWVARDRRLLLLTLTLPVWGVGQLVSDEVNDLGPRFSLQLAAALTMMAIVPALVWVARHDLRRMYVVQVGVALGMVAEWVLVEHVPLASTASWKYALNVPVAIAVLALTDLAWRAGRRLPSLLGLAFVVVLGAVTDSRHLAAVAVLTALLMVLPRNPRRHPRMLSTVAGLTILLGALSGAFLQSAGAGWIGERTDQQVSRYGSNPVTFLVNVRPEVFQEFYLSTRRPVFGWGSQPKMDSETFAASMVFLRDIGVRRTDISVNWKDLEVPGVAAHSTSVDSWLRGGVGAVPFWLLAMGLAMRTGILATSVRASPVVVFWTMLILWNMFFEPMTSRYHLELGAYLALAFTALRAMERDRAGSASASTQAEA